MLKNDKKKGNWIFFKTKYPGILLFLVENYTMKTFISNFYILPESTTKDFSIKNMNIKQSKNKYGRVTGE